MRVVVVGCGSTGRGVAEAMSLRGHSVTVVDKDLAALHRLARSFKGRTMEGDGLDRKVLTRAGIDRCDGLAVVTDRDEVNFVIGRIAGSFFRVPRVVARLYDPGKAEVYRGLGLQVVAQTTWGVNRIAELLCFSELDTTFSLGNGEIDLVAVEIPASLAGSTVRDLTVSGEVHVVAITRRGRSLLPTPTTPLYQGDLVYVATLATSTDRLKAILGLP